MKASGLGSRVLWCGGGGGVVKVMAPFEVCMLLGTHQGPQDLQPAIYIYIYIHTLPNMG